MIDKYLKAIVEKDQRGIKSIYDDFQARIIKYVKENNGTGIEGEDIFQEAIIIIFKQSRKEDFKLTVPFYTYLFAVCKRLWLKKLRKKRNMIVTFPEDVEYIDEDKLEAIIIEEERYSLFRAKFRNLSDQCQLLLGLFFKKVSMKDIMEQMGFSSLSYTKKRKYQCKEKLISLIQNDSQYNRLL